MEQEKTAMLAVSLAGHDKGTMYVVLSREDDMLVLADGKNKLLERPKRKKEKHVQIIKQLPEEIKKQIWLIVRDEDIRRVLKLYKISREQ
ncbi:MAG: KOW domain-containing RNA-binding protein [Lachnospiraceae bacterium]|nr:KOW domain-containing RNA-binding protein [Lachnospiraceae bacterium]